MRALAGDAAVNLAEGILPAGERYTHIDQGNAQALDHILVSRGLYTDCAELDIVHANAEFADRPVNGDPLLARFFIPPSAAVPATVTLAATPAVIAADGSSASVIVATVRDGAGAVLPSATVTFTTTAGSIAPFAVTDGNGSVTVTLTSAQQPATALVTARAGVAAGSVSVVFEARRVASLTVTASPASLFADGLSTSAIVAQARDQFGSPMSGAPINLAASLGSVEPQSGFTDASGAFTSTLTAGRDPGQAVVTVVSAPVAASVSVTFEPAPAGLMAEYRSSASRASRGDWLAYTFVVTNTGPADMSSVGMAAEVPTGTVLLYVSGGWPELRQVGWPITWRGLAAAMRTVTWTGKLAAGQSHTLRFVVWVNAASGVLTSHAAYGVRPGLESTLVRVVEVVPSPQAHARAYWR